MNTKRQFLGLMAGVAASAALPGAALAQDAGKLRLAYVPGIGNLPFYIAESKGFFKAEGIEYEGIPINTGPGAVSAVVSKSADVGFGGTLPTILARSEGIPLRFICGGYYEKEPLFSDSALIAGSKSGIKTVADLRGKKIAVNNAGGINDLQVRLKLKEAGIPMDQVKMLSVPFPQMQAALEMGNADAVGTVDPFRTSILQKKLGTIVARGYVQQKDLSRAIPVAGYYASEEWLKAHGDMVARLKRVLVKANEYIAANPAEARSLLVQRLRFAPDLAAEITLPPYTADLEAGTVQAVMDAALSVGILKRPMSAAEIMPGGDK